MTPILTVAQKKSGGGGWGCGWVGGRFGGSDFFSKSSISTHLKSGRPYVHLRSDGPRPILG